MLEALRRGAQTRAAKVLFGLLVAAFSLWGVHDVFKGWGRGAVAKVGSTAISDEDFRRAYQDEIERVSRQAQRRITPEQGRTFGLDKQVLSQLIGSAAVEAHAGQLGLALSNKTLVDGIANDPNFKDNDGKFTIPGFQNLLRRIGLTEQGFLNLRRKDELRAALFNAFLQAQTVPKPLFDMMHAYNGEKRVIEWVKIDPDAVTVAAPTDAKLKELYEKDKARYMTPEYRKVQVLLLTTDELKKQATISDDDIAKAYEKDKDSYNTPEQRRIQQIAFKDKAAAAAALASLRSGKKTFGDVAKDAGAKDTDVDLGLIAKKSMIDPKVANAAFSLEKDKYSDVIEGRFATVILRVTQIVPGVTRTLADVKADVRDKLATETAKNQLSTKRDEADDNRIAGKSLKEIADALKIGYKEIPATDKTGLGPDGKPVMEGPDLQKIVTRAFSPDLGSDDASIDLTDGGSAWVSVAATDAPKQKPFEQVKDQVKDNYLTSERHRLIDELAKKLTDRVNAGEPMSALEKDAKNKVEKTDAITRKTSPQSLTDGIVAQAFALAKGKAAHGPTSDRTTEIVFRVAEIAPAAAPTLTETDGLNRELASELVNQSLSQYTEALKKRYGTTINPAEMKAALGLQDE